MNGKLRQPTFVALLKVIPTTVGHAINGQEGVPQVAVVISICSALYTIHSQSTQCMFEKSILYL